jgi:hypothetical protein
VIGLIVYDFRVHMYVQVFSVTWCCCWLECVTSEEGVCRRLCVGLVSDDTECCRDGTPLGQTANSWDHALLNVCGFRVDHDQTLIKRMVCRTCDLREASLYRLYVLIL